MPTRITFIDWIVEGVRISVCADGWICWMPPIGLNEAGAFWIAIARVQMGQTCFNVVTFVDIAFDMFRGEGLLNNFDKLTEGVVGRLTVMDTTLA